MAPSAQAVPQCHAQILLVLPLIYARSDMAQTDGGTATPNLNPYDSYVNSVGTMPEINASNQHSQVNPYAQETTSLTGPGTAYYQGQGGYAQPVG